MSQFTTPFVGELIGRNLWRVKEPFEYHVGEYPSKEIIKVPIGFITNFASVPRIFWPIISPIDSHGKAAVVHDYCYYTALYPRKRCDEIFLEGMIVLKVGTIKRTLIYHTVRYCGYYNWYKARLRERKIKKYFLE